MGTFAKRLGQVAAKSLETESANILKTVQANKIEGSLAKAFDSTLREGHDMKAFGLGTAASMANRERYARFTTSMHAVYAAMESEFALCSATAAPGVHMVWGKYGSVLARADRLRDDLVDVGIAVSASGDLSPATGRYVDAVQKAGDRDRSDGGCRLLGHLYCRYFADLFGGQMLGAPTRVALSLPAGTPRHYNFDFEQEQTTRRSLIEGVYASINEAGNALSAEQAKAATDEALAAFHHNSAVYGEEPVIWPAVVGVANIAKGFAVGRR